MKENYLLNWQQEPRNPPPSQEDSPHHSFPGGSIKCHHRHFSFRCRHSLNNEFRGANNSQHQQHYYCYPAQQKARRKNQSSQKFHKTPPSLFPVIRRLSTAIKKVNDYTLIGNIIITFLSAVLETFSLLCTYNWKNYPIFKLSNK